MTKIKRNRSGFTRSGFMKGFSCCGHWNTCEYAKKDCVYKESDPETMSYCRVYQRAQQNKAMSLFNELDVEKIDEIFLACECEKKEQKDPKEDWKSRIKKQEEEIKNMTDYQLLMEAAKRWVAMYSLRGRIRSAMEKGDYKEAFHYFKKMINTSGSGGGVINFNKYGSQIEITTFDNYLLTPTEKELFNAYCEWWKDQQEINLFNI